jgi:dipeptidyl-peptidase-4
MKLRCKFLLLVFCVVTQLTYSQNRGINWTADGLAFLKVKEEGIVKVDPKTEAETPVITKAQLTPVGNTTPLRPQSFDYSTDKSKLLLFTNTAKVWRYNTRGDYWVLNIAGNQLKKLGQNLPAQSLMFAKFSPDGRFVAYVSGNNIYAEDIASGQVRKLTTDGTRKLINGTFDWVYE